jgi:hypothetical protein
MTELQRCSKCKYNKLLKFFKVRENTGKIYKMCISCSERFKCDVEDCEYTCSLNSCLKRHIKSVHDKIKDFKCELCDYTCSLNSDLKRHIKSVHDKIKDFKCELCDYTCSKNSNLKEHIKQVHDKIKDFKCELCDYTCSLKKHIKQVHDKIKDFKCELCDYTCSQNIHLKQHILICKGEDHSNMSGLELRTKEALNTLGFVENEDYIFNSSYSKLTDFCGRPLRPDFRFINHKIIIECDGIQHFKAITFGGISTEKAEKTFKSTQETDNIKNEFCEKYCYKMIRIKFNEIKDLLRILHYELLDIIDEVTE